MRAVLAAALLILALALPVRAVDYWLVPDQTGLHVGDTLTYHAFVPQAAMRQTRNPQIPFNPETHTWCPGWSADNFMDTKDRTKDGFIITTYPVVIGGTGGQCSALTYYWTIDKGDRVILNSVAAAYFEVLP